MAGQSPCDLVCLQARRAWLSQLRFAQVRSGVPTGVPTKCGSALRPKTVHRHRPPRSPQVGAVTAGRDSAEAVLDCVVPPSQHRDTYHQGNWQTRLELRETGLGARIPSCPTQVRCHPTWRVASPTSDSSGSTWVGWNRRRHPEATSSSRGREGTERRRCWNGA